MSVEEASAHIARVDRTLRGNKPVEEEAKSFNLSPLYKRFGWGRAGPSPLPEDALTKLRLEDKTADNRWSKHFLSNGVHIGVYRSQVGYYWLLRFEGAVNEHWVENIGTAADVEARFG